MKVRASTPSRICLFGEHQDYLGLEVIASAIDLRFSAEAEDTPGDVLAIDIRDSSISELGQKNVNGLYQHYEIDLSRPIVFDQKRDYFKSIVKQFKKHGCKPTGAHIRLDSEIPIGKGMCSSTTMVLVMTAALAKLWGFPKADDPVAMAELAWDAEVGEFGEPGGRMDHYASALGGLAHMDFRDGKTVVERLPAIPSGCFILFDSLEPKDTLDVLSKSKYPTLEGLKLLAPYGITSIRDFYEHPEYEELVSKLDGEHARKIRANISNYRIQREALAMLSSGVVDDEKLGELLNRHQANLRDGLGISTDTIDRIIETAIANGAYGGKFNGSGGGGCLYVYSAADKAQQVIDSVNAMGYPGAILHTVPGLHSELVK